MAKDEREGGHRQGGLLAWAEQVDGAMQKY
jgi:hypothetical protein